MLGNTSDVRVRNQVSTPRSCLWRRRYLCMYVGTRQIDFNSIRSLEGIRILSLEFGEERRWDEAVIAVERIRSNSCAKCLRIQSSLCCSYEPLSRSYQAYYSARVPKIQFWKLRPNESLIAHFPPKRSNNSLECTIQCILWNDILFCTYKYYTKVKAIKLNS